MGTYADILQDSAYPDDYPASVGYVLRRLYAGRALVEGYLYEGAFYTDSDHTNLITATSERLYVDLATGTAYRWNGTAYVSVSVSAASDTAAVHYTADSSKSAEQKAQARSNIGAAAATDLATLQSTVAGLSAKESTWDAKMGAMSFDNAPTESSENLVKSGKIYTWVTNLFTNLTVAWSRITNHPTTVAGYGITDAVAGVKVGTSGTVTPDSDGVVRLPAYADAGAVKFDAAQTLTASQKLQARKNIGASSTAITNKAQLVADAFSSNMTDSQKAALLAKIVDYIKEKEGVS